MKRKYGSGMACLLIVLLLAGCQALKSVEREPPAVGGVPDGYPTDVLPISDEWTVTKAGVLHDGSYVIKARTMEEVDEALTYCEDALKGHSVQLQDGRSIGSRNFSILSETEEWELVISSWRDLYSNWQPRDDRLAVAMLVAPKGSEVACDLEPLPMVNEVGEHTIEWPIVEIVEHYTEALEGSEVVFLWGKGEPFLGITGEAGGKAYRVVVWGDTEELEADCGCVLQIIEEKEMPE